MHEVDMLAARALVTKAELEELLAAPATDASAGQEAADVLPPDAGLPEEAGRRLMEQTFHHWEQTVRDLQLEVKALRARVEQLERTHEAPQPAKPPLPELPTVVEQESPRLSRAERHRKSRWF